MKRRLLCLVLAMVLVFSLFPTAAFAAGGSDLGSVTVIVENTTFDENDTGWDDNFWKGELVNTTVDLTAESTMMSCIAAALEANEYAAEGINSGYISAINGLAEYNGGPMSGWMGTLNDWMTNVGFNDITVAEGELCGGDVIRVMYTCDWGADLGGGFGTNLGYLSTLSAGSGTLSPVFHKDTLAYTLTVPAGVDTVDITAAAKNKNDKVTVSVGDIEYRRGKTVPVADGVQIAVVCGVKTYIVTVVQENAQQPVVNVDFTVQEGGAFLLAPRFEVAVSGDLAERYGYADSVADGVSALDVLVKAHALQYPGFAEDPQSYLALNESGFLTTVFGAKDSNFSFMVNGEMPNDGILNDDNYAPGGKSYTGYSIAQCPVENGDALEFFRYQDDAYYTDNYGWAEYQGSRASTVTVRPDAAVTLTYKGFCVAYYGCVPMETLMNLALVEAVEGAQLAWVSTENGVLTDIRDACTDADGKAAFTAPTAEGTYYLTAYIPAEEIENDATPLVMSLIEVVVDRDAPQPEVPAASADLTALSVADFGSNPNALELTPAFSSDVTGYTVDPVNFQRYAKMAYVKATAASETAVIKTALNGTEKNVTSGDPYWTAFNNMQPGQDNVLTVTVTDGDLNKTYTVTIPMKVETIAVTGISLDKTELTLTAGKTATLTASVQPDNASDKTVNWTSSDDTVAAVENGVVTAVAAGNAIITARAGEKSAACAVTVQAPLPDAGITVPSDARLFVGEKTGGKHYVPFTEKPAAAKVNNGDGTTTYYYDLKTNSQYNYRVSGEGYVTCAGVFKKTAGYSLTVAESDLKPEGRNSKTVDHNVTSNGGYNVADIYLNINAQNYLKLAQAGDTHQLVNLRSWQTVDTITSNYFIEPDYHYTVLNENGQADNSVVTVSDSGLITANQTGTAIVLVTYDAINVASAAGGPFFGAIWPENTGVFVVSVGAQDSGISTGMTINETVNEGKSFKNDGTALDAEHDVIYFLGESGSYTFTPGTDGVTVTVANPAVDETMTFSGFTGDGVSAENGVVTVPLKEGRNIVKLEKDGKAEYQVITAKQVTVTINDGRPVKPGDTVSVKFSTIYDPINKLAGVYNYAPAIVYTEVEGMDGKMLASKGTQHKFAGTAAAQTVANFMTIKEQWGASTISVGSSFVIPADYSNETMTLSGGVIGFGGWGSWAGEHRNINLTDGKLPNLHAGSPFGYLGQLPDIVIDIELPTVDVTGVTLDRETLTLTAGETATLTASVQPENASDKTVNWTSSDDTVAAVENGVVTAVAPGTATITAEAGGKSVNCTVTVEAKPVTFDEIYAKTAAVLMETEVSTGSIKGEWLMFGLARALDKEPTDQQKADYLDAVKSYIKGSINDAGQLHQYKSTDNSRIALALTALGCDPADFEGYDLLKAFGDTAWATQQGSTGTAFALLALRAADYPVSNEQALIDSLLKSQKPDGGWAINAGSSDLDATAMVIQALAPDYLTSQDETADSANVKTAVDNALAFLAGKMQDDGTVTDDTSPASAETIAQLLVALAELGRNPAEDTQFTKNGKTLLDGLTSFYREDQGFAHEKDGGFNQMATEQAFYAMVACRRLAAEERSLYDMSIARVTKYTVTVADTANGQVTVEPELAPAGAAITVIVTADIGYELKSLAVTDSSNAAVMLNGSTFTMPAADVTVSALFAKTENPVEDVEAAIDGLSVSKADSKTQAALEQAEHAYNDLSAEQKEGLKNAGKLTNLRQTFDRLLKEAKDAAKEELRIHFRNLKESDYTQENWNKLQKLLNDGLADIEKAKNTDEINSVRYSVIRSAEAIAKGGQITVTFRLIGDTKHDNGVTDHGKYVTWIPTTTYTLNPGATMYDVFIQAIADNGLSQKGASGNYVSSIKAPEVLGGYWLGEFDNGKNSGWMYTVNGNHPSVGLKDYILKDGDRIIWHYVDDYTKEEGKFTWLEAEDIFPGAYAKKQEMTDTAGFTDVTKNDWFYDDVQFAVKNGLFKGISNTAFSPNAAMNRAMLVTVLYRLEGEPKVTGSSEFNDVAGNRWYTDAVIWAAKHKIVNGYGNGMFGPTDSITREQMAAILYRYAQYRNCGVKASNSLTGYSDCTQISAYALQPLKWASAEGLINGRTRTTLVPQGTATRAEVAAILHRFVENVMNAD